MTRRLLFSYSLVLVLGGGLAAPACAQVLPISATIGLAGLIAGQIARNKALARKTTTTFTYHGQRCLLKRTPANVLTGDATDRIEQLEAQLAQCHAALLADSTGRTCPPERQALIREDIRYIDLARPNWSQKAYRQEFKFYLAEDNRRRRLAAR